MFNFFKYAKSLGVLVAGSVTLNHFDSLGIMGFLGNDTKAVRVVLDGLEDIKNNDYDSAGIAFISGSEDKLMKFVSTPETPALSRLRSELLTQTLSSKVAIGHTHISRRGQISEAKAHPQTDHKNRIYLVHNGSITNSNELLQFVESRGIVPKTNSNTELLAILIGIFVEDGHPFKVATRLALEKVNGSWGIVAMDKMNPENLIVGQKGSALFMTRQNKNFIISSDEEVLNKTQFSENKIIKLEDGFLYSLDSSSNKVESIRVKDVNTLLSLGDSPHWTIKEIEEQPQSVARAISYGARLTTDSARLKGLEEMKIPFLSVKNLVLIGCGSSFHACQFGSHIMRQLELMDTITTLDPSTNCNFLPHLSPGAILISESGETSELLSLGSALIAEQIPTISIVNEVSSSLAKLIGHGVYMNAGKEVGEAATKSFLSSCVVLIEVALWLSKFEKPGDSEYRKKIVQALLSLPMMTGSVIAMNREDTRQLAQELKGSEHLFVLGRGMAESIAYEGAALIKQLALIHAEGYAGGALKHGPFALIDDGRAIILIILDDEHKEMMNLALAEVQARNAKTIVITPNRQLITTKEPPHKVLLIEENGPLTGLLALIPLQLLAYYLSILREIDPDYPSSSETFISIN